MYVCTTFLRSALQQQYFSSSRRKRLHPVLAVVSMTLQSCRLTTRRWLRRTAPYQQLANER